ncbi:MAG: hypothetical protein ABIG03_02760 [Candidatus Eisenbacteria bacterium]
MRLRSWHQATITALVALASHVAALRLLPYADELHSLLWTALSLKDASLLMRPWMGGVLRLPPKLVLVAGLASWGPRAWVFHLVVVLLHAVNAVLVGRLGARLSGSRPVGFTSGLLFAVGFGAYGKAVFSASNITIVLALLLLLVSVDLLLSRRWLWSAVLLALAAASHEIALGALPLVPVIVLLREDLRRRDAPTGERASAGVRWVCFAVAGGLAATIVCSVLPINVTRLFRLELGMVWFMLFPFNTGTAAAVGGPAWLNVLEDVLVSGRSLLGGALAVVFTVLLMRRSAFVAVAVAWVYAALFPAAVFISGWGGDWMERRYLYVASVGACMLAAGLLARVRARSRFLAAALLVLLLVWSVGLTGMVWRKSVADSLTSDQIRHRREYLLKLGSMDPHWAEIAEAERRRG